MLRDPNLVPLSHQHQHALALCVMTRRSLADDTSPENLAALAHRIVERFEIEIANHFEVEEQVLFPACGPMPLIPDLIAEHRALEALVSGVRAAPSPDLLERFCTLLTSHIRREENDLFQQIQRDLPHDLLQSLGQEIDRRTIRICL